jgi:ADP-ribose pyrophosphatase
LGETLHIYLALDLERGEMHLDENEFLSLEAVPLAVLVDKIMADEIRDGKTIIGLFKAEKYLKGNGQGGHPIG